MNKKGQYARAAARTSATIARENRKVYARACQLLGFDIFEISNALGVSSNTVRTYLRELGDVGYSDLLEFSYRNDVFGNFSSYEQDFLNYLKDTQSKGNILTKESRRTHRIFHGKGIVGLFHKLVLKDCHEFEKKNDDINKKIHKLKLEIDKRIKGVSNKELYPHLSKSYLDFKTHIVSDGKTN